MPQYTLHYFNLNARGQLARLAFAAAGVEFTDHRIEFPEWPELKKNTSLYPFGTLPSLEVDGKVLPESIAIARYLSDEFGLSGKNNWDRAWVGVVVDTLQELRNDCVAFSPFSTKYKDDESKKESDLKELVEGKMAKKLQVLEGILKSNNGGTGYFVGDSLTLADLMLVDISEGFMKLSSTCYDATPLIKDLNKRVRDLPKIKAFLDARPEAII
eukprot:gene17472-19219_t